MSLQCFRLRRKAAEEKEMGCTSAKQVSSVPNSEEEQNKAHSNGDIVPGMYSICSNGLSYRREERLSFVV